MSGSGLKTKPRVAIMNAVHDLPVLVARDKGFFKDEGLDIEFVATPGMAQVTTLPFRQVRLDLRSAARFGLQRGRHRHIPHVRMGHHEARGRGRRPADSAGGRSSRSAPRCQSSPSSSRGDSKIYEPEMLKDQVDRGDAEQRLALHDAEDARGLPDAGAREDDHAGSMVQAARGAARRARWRPSASWSRGSAWRRSRGSAS